MKQRHSKHLAKAAALLAAMLAFSCSKEESIGSDYSSQSEAKNSSSSAWYCGWCRNEEKLNCYENDFFCRDASKAMSQTQCNEDYGKAFKNESDCEAFRQDSLPKRSSSSSSL